MGCPAARGFRARCGVLPEVRPSWAISENKSGRLRHARARPFWATSRRRCWASGEFENSAALNYGTGAFLLVNTGSRLVKVRGILNSIGWQAAGDKAPCYFLESTVNSAATALEWLKVKFGLFSELSEVDGLCRLSRNRLLCLPAIGGIGAPYWDYSTFTTFSGFSPHTDKHDVVRGVVEGIAYMVGDAFDLIKKKGFDITEIRASGGLSNIDWLLQFQADITGAKVLRMEDTEATALGAAIGAVRAAGIELPGKAKISREFTPDVSEEERANLIKGWRVFIKDIRRTSSDVPAEDPAAFVKKVGSRW